MKKRRATSEQRADKLNRYLAEMVLRPPPANGHARASTSRRTPPQDRKSKGKTKVKVKEESVEPDLVLRDREPSEPPITAFSPPPPNDADAGETKKAIALNLVDFGLVLSLVFGGCCSNVWTYEYLMKIDPHMGMALTFSQMCFVTIQSLPSFLTYYPPSPNSTASRIPRLKPRQVPISSWASQVLVLTAGSLLNNQAVAYQVPISVQIVFRSAGLAVSMLFGRIFLRKSYTILQVISVLIVTLGVILSTTSTPTASSRPSSSSSSSAHIPVVDLARYTMGVIMLSISLLLTGVLGMLQEQTYTRYGPCWKEGLFYTHALSIPIFIPWFRNIRYGFHSLKSTHASQLPLSSFLLSFPSIMTSFLKFPSISLSSSSSALNTTSFDSSPFAAFNATSITGLGRAGSDEAVAAAAAESLAWLAPYLILAVNLVTQLVCVSGVNQLTSRLSSVSTNLVLTTRKALSLCFSVWWFGAGWNAQLAAGAGMVFAGSVAYTLVTSTLAKDPPSRSPSTSPPPSLASGTPPAVLALPVQAGQAGVEEAQGVADVKAGAGVGAERKPKPANAPLKAHESTIFVSGVDARASASPNQPHQNQPDATARRREKGKGRARDADGGAGANGQHGRENGYRINGNGVENGLAVKAEKEEKGKEGQRHRRG